MNHMKIKYIAPESQLIELKATAPLCLSEELEDYIIPLEEMDWA